MSMELWQRLKDLEKKVEEMSGRLNHLWVIRQSEANTPSGSMERAASSPDEPPAKKMSPCPKCGVKPAYFFHVKHCKGAA